MAFRSSRNARISSAELPFSSSMRLPPSFAGGGVSASTSVALPASTPRSASADLRLGLLARAHDRLERGVARLVDGVRDRDDGRQRRLDDVVARLALPLRAHAAVGQLEPGDLRHERELEVLGDGRGHDVGVGVGRLLAEQHEVGPEMLRGGRQHAGGRGDVGALERRIADQQRLVRAQRERLVQRPHGALGAHAERRDEGVGAGCALLQPHGLFERMRVVGVHGLLAGAVEPLRARVDPLGSGRVRHFLDAHGDLQRCSLLVAPMRAPTARPVAWRIPIGGVPKRRDRNGQMTLAASATWPPPQRAASDPSAKTCSWPFSHDRLRSRRLRWRWRPASSRPTRRTSSSRSRGP